jgi:hypothetical protein
VFKARHSSGKRRCQPCQLKPRAVLGDLHSLHLALTCCNPLLLALTHDSSGSVLCYSTTQFILSATCRTPFRCAFLESKQLSNFNIPQTPQLADICMRSPTYPNPTFELPQAALIERSRSLHCHEGSALSKLALWRPKQRRSQIPSLA